MSDTDKHVIEGQQLRRAMRKRKQHPATLKGLAAAERAINNPHAEKPPAHSRYLAISEQGLRGHHEVERGDGHNIVFQNHQYRTNDSAEAALLAKMPGISVEERQKDGRAKRKGTKVYSMGVAFGPDGKVIHDET